MFRVTEGQTFKTTIRPRNDFQRDRKYCILLFFFHHKKGNTISLIDTWTRVTPHDSYDKKMIHANQNYFVHTKKSKLCTLPPRTLGQGPLKIWMEHSKHKKGEGMIKVDISHILAENSVNSVICFF